jgi:DNA-binding beta-propeller fold protein YncE
VGWLQRRAHTSTLADISSPSLSDGSAAGDYDQPADVAELDGLVYVLDTGNNRILTQDQAGNVLQVVDGSRDGEPDLRGAMSITTDGRHLYVANTALSQIIILEPGGRAVQTIDLSADASGRRHGPSVSQSSPIARPRLGR